LRKIDEGRVANIPANYSPYFYIYINIDVFLQTIDTVFHTMFIFSQNWTVSFVEKVELIFGGGMMYLWKKLLQCRHRKNFGEWKKWYYPWMLITHQKLI